MPRCRRAAGGSGIVFARCHRSATTPQERRLNPTCRHRHRHGRVGRRRQRHHGASPPRLASPRRCASPPLRRRVGVCVAALTTASATEHLREGRGNTHVPCRCCRAAGGPRGLVAVLVCRRRRPLSTRGQSAATPSRLAAAAAPQEGRWGGGWGRRHARLCVCSLKNIAYRNSV